MNKYFKDLVKEKLKGIKISKEAIMNSFKDRNYALLSLILTFVSFVAAFLVAGLLVIANLNEAAAYGGFVIAFIFIFLSFFLGIIALIKDSKKTTSRIIAFNGTVLFIGNIYLLTS